MSVRHGGCCGLWLQLPVAVASLRPYLLANLPPYYDLGSALTPPRRWGWGLGEFTFHPVTDAWRLIWNHESFRSGNVKSSEMLISVSKDCESKSSKMAHVSFEVWSRRLCLSLSPRAQATRRRLCCHSELRGAATAAGFRNCHAWSGTRKRDWACYYLEAANRDTSADSDMVWVWLLKSSGKTCLPVYMSLHTYIP